ncbi:MAG: hypothetical protein LW629_09505 [Burkholderiales bacterium]|nr:hypothetical protein [Burkholderiales bacterium]
MPNLKLTQHSILNPLASDFQPLQNSATTRFPTPPTSALVEAYKAVQLCISRNLAPSAQKESLTTSEPFKLAHADMRADEVLESLWQLSDAVEQTLQPLERTNQLLNRCAGENLLAWNEHLSNEVSRFLETLAPQETHALLELMSGRFFALKLILGAISEHSPSIQLIQRMAKEHYRLKDEAATPVKPEPPSAEPTVSAPETPALQDPAMVQTRPVSKKQKAVVAKSDEAAINDHQLIQQAIESNKPNQQSHDEQEGAIQIDRVLDVFINKLEKQKKTKQTRQERIQSVLKNMSLAELFSLVSSIETWNFRKEAAYGTLNLKPRKEKEKNCFETAMVVFSKWPSISKTQGTSGQIMQALNQWSEQIEPQAQHLQTSTAVHIQRCMLSADYASALITASMLSGKHQIFDGVGAARKINDFVGILSSGTSNYITAMQAFDEVPVIGQHLKKIYTDLLDTLSKQIDPNGSFDQEMVARFNSERSKSIKLMVRNCYKHRIALLESELLKDRANILEPILRISAVAGLRQFGILMTAPSNIVSRLGLRRSPSNYVLFHMLTEVMSNIHAIPAPEPEAGPAKTEPNSA